jgi:hypothetical protein
MKVTQLFRISEPGTPGSSVDVVTGLRAGWLEEGFQFLPDTVGLSVLRSVHTGSQAHPALCAANTFGCCLPIGV